MVKEKIEAREALAEAMHSEDWLTPWDEAPYQQDDSDWAKPIAYAPDEQQTYLEYADAAIAHLWSRADDPDVVGAMKKMLTHNETASTMTQPEHAVSTFLSKLIGARPDESETG